MFSKHYSLHSARQNLSRLASGTVLSQILLLASTPFLTRLYSPDAFGIMAIFSASYAILIPIATLKYDAAVSVTGSTYSARYLSSLIIILITFFSSISLVVISLYLKISSNPKFDVNFFYLPLALWLGGVYTIFQQWSARRCDYNIFSKALVCGGVVNVSTSLLLGYIFEGNEFGIIIGFLSGLLCSVLYIAFNEDLIYINVFDFKTKNIRNLFKYLIIYSRFPRVVLPTALLLCISQSILPIVIQYFYTNNDVGQFSVANRLLLIPSALIGAAIAETFKSEFLLRLRQKKQATPILMKTLFGLLVVAVPLFLVLSLISPILFRWIFGENYFNSGYIARSMAIGVAVQFVVMPFSSIFIALRQERIGLLIQFTTTLIPIIVLVIASIAGLVIENALFFYSLSNFFMFFIMLRIIFSISKTYDKEKFR